MVVFYIGDGEGWCVSLTLCRYDIRMVLLLVRSWARVRRVSLWRESSEGDILGACGLGRVGVGGFEFVGLMS